MRILPSNSLLLGRRRLATLKAGIGLGVVIVSAGCAKFPATSSAQNIHLIFTMSVAGHIQDGSQSGEAPYIYIIAVNPSTDLFPISTGPEPVISQPWGNGFVAGGATHFIQYALGQVSPYTVYQFTDSSLMAWVATGVPINTSTTTNKIQFEIDISQIKPSDVSDVSTLQSVQVNFLTMNRRPQGGDTGSKVWDALGNSGDPNSINDYVRIPLTSSRIYTNADFQDLEPQGDCPDPNLDIVDWSVEVRKP